VKGAPDGDGQPEIGYRHQHLFADRGESHGHLPGKPVPPVRPVFELCSHRHGLL
jgi:hypothetical protein